MQFSTAPCCLKGFVSGQSRVTVLGLQRNTDKFPEGCHVDDGADLFSIDLGGRTRINGFELQGRVLFNARKSFLMVKTVEEQEKPALEGRQLSILQAKVGSPSIRVEVMWTACIGRGVRLDLVGPT